MLAFRVEGMGEVVVAAAMVGWVMDVGEVTLMMVLAGVVVLEKVVLDEAMGVLVTVIEVLTMVG